MNFALIILIIILIALIVITVICLIKKDSFENNGKGNDKPNIVLITEYFVHKFPIRFNEIKTSIDKNDKNKYIDRIYLLNVLS